MTFNLKIEDNLYLKKQQLNFEYCIEIGSVDAFILELEEK
jgi:hypothetical protein